jgi:pimeloyl-ACP methyl ester carboxylesterase
MRIFTAIRNRMEPNSTTGKALFSTSAAAEEGELEVTSLQQQQYIRSDEPNLYDFPTSLSPTYTSLPHLSRILLGVFCICIATESFSIVDISPSVMRLLVGAAKRQLNIRMLLRYLIKAILIYLIGHFTLQELLTPPSRITTSELCKDFFLPSRLSRYERVTLPEGSSIGVHWLQYDLPPDRMSPNHDLGIYSALHMNHGFGASSLSWLPVLPKLADRLKIPRTLAHDAPGFGFTDRPTPLKFYGPKTSSQIGLQLLSSNSTSVEKSDFNASSSIILMGHSLGSFATLEMAASLPDSLNLVVVLVAPAFGIRKKTKKSSSINIDHATIGNGIITSSWQFFARYFLRRLVGSKNFWRKALHGVWGNPNLVSESDVLRFQWPAIGKGWEDGLLRFARAMTQQFSIPEESLIQSVVNRPNTRIVIISGSKDKVIPKRKIQKAFSSFPEIPILDMEGCGHDPFEEKTDEFISLLERYLVDNKSVDRISTCESE